MYDAESEDEDKEGDTDVRKKLRAERHARNRARIQNALQEKRDRENIAAAEQAERQVLKDLIGSDIEDWAKANKDVRLMLAHLGHVLWEGHGYKEPGLHELMTPSSVKKQYHRAMLLCHPDKVKQKGGDASMQLVADKVFDLLSTSYKTFCANES